jgi:nuclear pore complex protein Nup85
VLGSLLSFSPHRTTLRGLTKASVFFLDILSRHPSQHVQHLSSRLAPLLDSHPRLQNFPSERDHAAAARKWKDQVKILRLELDRVPEAARDDTFENWWNWMSDIVGVLEGRADVLKRVCFDLGSDWKEVCAAWTIFVNVRLRRADLP